MRNRKKQRLIKKIVRGGVLNWKDETGTKDPTAYFAIKNLVEYPKKKGEIEHEYYY